MESAGWSDHARGSQAKQLDEGIGDTLVSVNAMVQ